MHNLSSNKQCRISALEATEAMARVAAIEVPMAVVVAAMVILEAIREVATEVASRAVTKVALQAASQPHLAALTTRQSSARTLTMVRSLQQLLI